MKGNSRVILGSVTLELYRRIEEYGRKASGANASSGAVTAEASAAKAAQEQNINKGSADTVAGAPAKSGLFSPPPNPWDTLRVGSRVLAAYWNESREFEGLWLAKVKRVEAGQFTPEWVEAPEFPPLKTRQKTSPFRTPSSGPQANSDRRGPGSPELHWGGFRAASFRFPRRRPRERESNPKTSGSLVMTNTPNPKPTASVVSMTPSAARSSAGPS